jgi:type IV secretion system protein VirD4
LQGGSGVQIYMTPQDDRTADVLSSALGRSTVTAVTESQSRIRALEDSANVSRRSEERPLISANELLRFPLDEVLVLPEGQYPIRARHVRYYEDRHFGPIDRARSKKQVLSVQVVGPPVKPSPASLSVLRPQDLDDTVEGSIQKATSVFQVLASSAVKQRRLPSRR